uniref:C2H2-type domain-containing protein n=1 Tax=Phlebotomus papatasi TaxID=29031 RepID=A0A1B0D8K2_PHLPP
MKSKIYPCDDCPRVYPTKALVKQHDLLKHLGKHVCINCKFVFDNAKKKYLEYLKKCSCGPEEKSRKNIKCHTCDRTFCRMQSLKNHIKIHEERKSSVSTVEKKSKLDYKCDRCPKVFPGTQALIDHIRAEHRGSLQCPKCTFRFYKEDELNVHLVDHKNLPFICKACNRLFKFSDSLKNHIKTYHKLLYKSDDSSESD